MAQGIELLDWLNSRQGMAFVDGFSGLGGKSWRVNSSATGVEYFDAAPTDNPVFTGTISGGSLSLTANATVDGGVIAGYLNPRNDYTTQVTGLTSPVIYGTSTGGSGIFNEAGHLIISPRISGAARNVYVMPGSGITGAIFKADGSVEFPGDITLSSLTPSTILSLNGSYEVASVLTTGTGDVVLNKFPTMIDYLTLESSGAGVSLLMQGSFPATSANRWRHHGGSNGHYYLYHADTDDVVYDIDGSDLSVEFFGDVSCVGFTSTGSDASIASGAVFVDNGNVQIGLGDGKTVTIGDAVNGGAVDIVANGGLYISGTAGFTGTGLTSVDVVNGIVVNGS